MSILSPACAVLGVFGVCCVGCACMITEAAFCFARTKQFSAALDIASQGLHGLTGCILCAHPQRPRAAPARGCSLPAPFKQGPRLLPPGTFPILLGLVLGMEALKDCVAPHDRIAVPHVAFALSPLPFVHASLVIDSSKHYIKVLLPAGRWSQRRLFHMGSLAFNLFFGGLSSIESLHEHPLQHGLRRLLLALGGCCNCCCFGSNRARCSN